ncbi:hypothetical protein [Rhodopirellula sp. MGV]|uniref:hypothetical protein n=1 Tax=Rhodopirellula sp. MGV TaxID=2023130 RepID=UPI000B967151|nr:hypothetical protein [Rhodopirellula sp. MGV]OYP38185.1 hypothetical protein CGZ80_02870 [Rhodopirellula sp. MGV]PNY38518.1 hypothetical protein C2E31_00900 [Rhodopirellula baltica]
MNVIAKQVESNAYPQQEAQRKDRRFDWQTPQCTRWQQANLFRNPFGELDRNERAELAVVDLEELVRSVGNRQPDGSLRFEGHKAFQLLGECGRGKTSRLLAVLRHVPDAEYVYLPEDQPCPAIPWGWPLVIDEAQRLPRRIRREVFRSGVPLILATHRDLTPSLRRAGYSVTSERIGLTLTPEKLMTILNRRIVASKRNDHLPIPTITAADAARLIQQFGTDVRAIESYLYDVVQQRVETDAEVRFID